MLKSKIYRTSLNKSIWIVSFFLVPMILNLIGLILFPTVSSWSEYLGNVYIHHVYGASCPVDNRGDISWGCKLAFMPVFMFLFVDQVLKIYFGLIFVSTLVLNGLIIEVLRQFISDFEYVGFIHDSSGNPVLYPAVTLFSAFIMYTVALSFVIYMFKIRKKNQNVD